MRRRLLALLALGLLAGCQQQVVPTPPPLVSAKTNVVINTPTPEPSPTPEPTAVPSPTATTEPGQASPTPDANPTPAGSPTVTPAPALGSGSYCTQTVGSGAERFSAQLSTLTLTSTAQFDVLTLTFDDVSGPLAASAACIAPADANSPVASSEITAVLRLDLSMWAHDEQWAESQALLTAPLRFEQTHHVRGLRIQPQSNRSAGLAIELGLDAQLPFQLKVAGNQLTVEIATAPGLGPDPLGTAQGRSGASVPPLVYNNSGDLWVLDGSSVRAIKLSPELESDFALSPNRAQVAFCRSAPGVAPELGALWVSDLDGGNERLLADIGGCADPVWAFDGSKIWFVAPWNAIPPLTFRLWEAALNSEPTPRSGLDEWSRTQPQPLPFGDVLMIGTDAVGGSTLLRYNAASQTTTDLGGELKNTYTGISDLLVAPDGKQAVASALRPTGGADLIWLDSAGAITATAGSDQWWSRPLAWSADGALFSITATCPAGRVLSYELNEYTGATPTLLASGQTLGAIGPATVVDNGLVYVRETLSATGERGPRPQITSASTLWLLDPASGDREQLLGTPSALIGVR